MNYVVYKQENPSGLNWFIRDNLGKVYGGYSSYDNAWLDVEFLQSKGKA